MKAEAALYEVLLRFAEILLNRGLVFLLMFLILLTFRLYLFL